jgi:hypothetical protein
MQRGVEIVRPHAKAQPRYIPRGIELRPPEGGEEKMEKAQPEVHGVSA